MYVCVNTLLAGVVKEKDEVRGVILESRSGREVIFAKSFVDCTGYGDMAGHAGAEFTEPNDYAVVNSMGLANVEFLDLVNEWGFSAVVLANGAWRDRSLPIEGAGSPSVRIRSAISSTASSGATHSSSHGRHWRAASSMSPLRSRIVSSLNRSAAGIGAEPLACHPVAEFQEIGRLIVEVLDGLGAKRHTCGFTDLVMMETER